MNDLEIHRIITGWHARAQLEDDDISRFAFLWFCFNAWLAYESEQGIDADMIRWLTGPHAAPPRLRSAFDRAMTSDSFRPDVQKLIDLSPIVDVSRSPRRPARADSPDDFAGVVQCLYRVRCNLFHGGKNPNDTRDQLLIRSAAQILDGWISHLTSVWQGRSRDTAGFVKPPQQ